MKVYTIPLGYTNCYLLEGDRGYVLVDAGRQHMAGFLVRRLKKLGLSPGDIRLIVITHAHFDHVGSLADIKKLCGCPVLAHPLEAVIIETGQVVIPPGTNRIGNLVSFMGSHSKGLLRFRSTRVELRVDQEYDLSSVGVAGRVIPTPGHTPGSLSVLLEDGQAMVGDLAMNFTSSTNYPIFAELPAQIRESWHKLLQQGAATIYPAHGKPFPAHHLYK